jgi:hypothetical protein
VRNGRLGSGLLVLLLQSTGDFEMPVQPRIFSGMQPTGDQRIGAYLGGLRQMSLSQQLRKFSRNFNSRLATGHGCLKGLAVTALGRLVVLLLVMVGISACRREAVDEDPERLVQEFIERTKSVYGDPRIARGAFEFLWSTAQKNLTERAARASALANRKVAPEEMLALTKFSLRFVPRKYSAVVQGDNAAVTVSGDSQPTDRAEVRCIREQGRWRVVLDLPPLAPIQRRPDATSDDE